MMLVLVLPPGALLSSLCAGIRRSKGVEEEEEAL